MKKMKKQSFVYGSAVLLISAALVKIISALFKIPLTNMLGGSAFGYFSCAYGLFLPIYAVTSSGLCAAVSKLTAESAALGNMKNVRKIYRVSMMFFSVIGVLGTVFAVIFAKKFAYDVVEEPQAFASVLIIAPSIAFGCITSVIRGHFEGMQNMYPTAVSQLVEAAAKLIFGLFCAHFTLESFESVKMLFPRGTTQYAAAAAAAVFGITLSSFFGMLSLFLFAKAKRYERNCACVQKDFSTHDILSKIIVFMLPIALGALVTNLTSLIDLLTINKLLYKCINQNYEYLSKQFSFIQSVPRDMLPSFIFGSFSGLAITIFTLVPSITNMLAKSVLSAASQAHAKNDCELLNYTAQKAITMTSLIAIPCSFGITVMPKEILMLLYSSRESEIEASYISLGILGISVVMLCLSYPLFGLLQGMGRADLPVKIMLIGVAAKLAGNFIFLSNPRTCIYGAAISTVICYAVILFMSLLALKKRFAVKIAFQSTVLPFLISGAICAAAARGVLHIADSSSKIVILLSISAGAAAYFAVLFLISRLNTEKTAAKR